MGPNWCPGAAAAAQPVSVVLLCRLGFTREDALKRFIFVQEVRKMCSGVVCKLHSSSTPARGHLLSFGWGSLGDSGQVLL